VTTPTANFGWPKPTYDEYADLEVLNEIFDGIDATLHAWRPGSATWLKANVNNVAYTSITRDANGAVTSATVVWPDGVDGVYTADNVSSAFPGAVDAFHVTYVGTPTRTVTQAAVTRDSTGAVMAQPELVVS
jgi:hypothetical protein